MADENTPPKTKVKIEPREDGIDFKFDDAPTDAPADSKDPSNLPPAPTGLSKDQESDLRELGWVPPEEFKGDPKNYKDPETFRKDLDKNGAAIDRLLQQARKDKSDLSQQVAALQAAVSTLTKGQSEQQQATTKAKADALMTKLREASELGDQDKVTEVGLELTKLGETAAAAPSAPVSTGKWYENEGMSRGVSNWTSRQDWVNKDYDKTAYAENVGKQMSSRLHEFASEEEFFAELDRAIASKFDKASDDDPIPPSATPGNRRGAGGRSSAYKDITSVDDLPDNIRTIARKQIKTLKLDEAGYLENYNATRKAQIARKA